MSRLDIAYRPQGSFQDSRPRCEAHRKVSYATEREVIKGLAEVRRQNHNENRYYFDEECGNWHLTSQKHWAMIKAQQTKEK